MMKVAYFVVVLLAALGLSLSLPANKNEEATTQKETNKDVDFVPTADKNFGGFPPGGVIDVDAGNFFGENPFHRTPFTSSFNSMEAAFTRMRHLLNQLLGRLPTEPVGPQDFPELHIPNFGNVDLGKGNTTSVTKVINGHKVTINDTEYKSDEANGSSFFKVHIVEVHPDAEDGTTKKDVEPVSPPKREPESVEETLNNEIPKIKDNEGSKSDENIETLDEVDVAPPHQFNNQWNKVADVENFEDNRLDSGPPKPYDLSNDIYVNQLLADSGAKTNPDAEVFTPTNSRAPPAQYYSAPSGPAYYNVYPSNVYDQRAMPQYRNAPYYAQPMVPMNDPYYSSFQPEQVMIVPMNNDQVSNFVPSGVHATSSSTHGITSNSQIGLTSTSSKTTPDKISSAASTT